MRNVGSSVFRAALEGMADMAIKPSLPIATAKAPANLAAADLIAEIKAILGVNITELALIAKVSRQTVYEWLDHGPISAPNYDRLFALRKIGLQWKTLANQPIGRLIHARTDDPLSLFERLLQDPLDVPAIPPLLAKPAARGSQDEESRQKRRRKLGPLADKAHYENLLTHVLPATDS